MTLNGAMQTARRDFVDRFAQHWVSAGGARIEGLIAGYLMLDESDGVSAQELAEELDLSRGSISAHTRALVDHGFVRRVRKPGDRAHYFVMDVDVWAGFLAAEQRYLERQRGLADWALEHLRTGTAARQRLHNMRDYMEWVIGLGLPRRWRERRGGHDDPGR